MITYNDVLAADASVANQDRAKVDLFIMVANTGFPDARFKGGKAATAQRGRVLYVLHMLNMPAVNITAPHVRRQMASPKPIGKKQHVWAGTEHGRALMKMIPDPARGVSLIRPAGR